LRILVVEDEKKIAAAVSHWLMAEGHVVEISENGSDAFQRVLNDTFDLVVLDVMLPGRDGLEVLAGLRHRGLCTPVLMLTAKDALEDRVEGLDRGADDYLVKPFAASELVARVRALLRRSHLPSSVLFTCADLCLDRMTREVTRAGQRVDLAPREYELLECLMRYQGHPVSRETIGREVWKELRRATPLDNVIDVHVMRLRKKVDADYATRLIHTVRGVGFLLQDGEP
jgi:DNA-binding response OmpR family regulator